MPRYLLSTNRDASRSPRTSTNAIVARPIASANCGSARPGEATPVGAAEADPKPPAGTAVRGLGWGVHEAGAVGEGDGLDTVAQAQFGEDVVDVRLNGGVGDEEGGSDLAVGAAVGDQAQDFEFAGR